MDLSFGTERKTAFSPILSAGNHHAPLITAFNLAAKEIPHPPVIHRILVNAWDEILVAGVRVMAHDENGR